MLCTPQQPPHNIGLRTCRFGSFNAFILDQSIADVFLSSVEFALISSAFETFTNVPWLKERIVHPLLGYCYHRSAAVMFF